MSHVPSPPPCERDNQKTAGARSRFRATLYRLRHYPLTGSNPPVGLLKDCGAHFAAGPGLRSPRRAGGAKGATRVEREPASTDPASPPKWGASGPGQRGPQGPRAPRAATAGPDADGGGSERGGAAARTVPPRAPGR